MTSRPTPEPPIENAIGGVCHIAVTPFDEDESIDHDSLARVIDNARRAGCRAVVALGIMGEAHKLTDTERADVLRTTVDAARDGLVVVAGVSAESTTSSIVRAVEAERLGADMVMLAPPRNAAVDDGLVDHFARVATATALPMIVQDEPVTTGVRLPGAFFSRVAEIDQVVAAKVEESPSPPKITVIGDAAPRLRRLGGLGGTSFFEELERGAAGIMTGFAFPEILVEIFELHRSADREAARHAFYRSLPLIRFEAQLGVGGVAIRKLALRERGVIDNAKVRAPTRPVDDRTVLELGDILEALGLG